VVQTQELPKAMKRCLQSMLPAVVVPGLLIGLLTACNGGSGMSGDAVDTPDSLGPFAVGHSVLSVTDPLRDNRVLAVELWYPVDAENRQDTPVTRYELAPGIGLASAVAVEDLPVSGRQKRPLVVFSHGYGGINTASVVLMETLASHGFIVASPEHAGNSQASGGDTFDQAAANRVPDVSLVIDALFDRGRQPGDSFYKTIDERRVGVVGHSFGGMTAVGMAAGWAGSGPDERVRAIVPISAVFDAGLQSDERTGPNAGFTAEQLGGITVPVMLIGGTADSNVFIENNSIAFEHMTAAPRIYKVDIVGATHNHFANVCDIGKLLIELGIQQDNWPAIGAGDLLGPYADACSPQAFPIDEVVRLQNLYVVSFFKRYLLGAKGYDYYLAPDFAAREPAVAVAVK